MSGPCPQVWTDSSVRFLTKIVMEELCPRKETMIQNSRNRQLSSYLDSSKSIAELARDSGIHLGNLREWKQACLEKQQNAFPGRGNPRDEELFGLKKQLESSPI